LLLLKLLLQQLLLQLLLLLRVLLLRVLLVEQRGSGGGGVGVVGMVVGVRKRVRCEPGVGPVGSQGARRRRSDAGSVACGDLQHEGVERVGGLRQRGPPVGLVVPAGAD
jgi:hypothetical protein